MYKSKAKEIILNPKNIGTLSEKDDHLLVCAKSGSYYLGSILFMQVLVEIPSGNIFDIKYKMFGTSLDLLSYEIISEFIKEKNHNQVKNITMALCLKLIKEYTLVNANNSVQLFLDAINSAISCCKGLNEQNITPIISNIENSTVKNWDALKDNQKIKIINDVIEEHIKPFVEIDGGSVVVESFHKDTLYVSFRGQCQQCPSSYGSTLEAIKNVIKSKTCNSLQIALSDNKHVDPK